MTPQLMQSKPDKPYWTRRKKIFPEGGGAMATALLVPSLETVAALVVQLVVVKSGFCCKVQFMNGEYAQEIFEPFVDRVRTSCGMGVAT